MKQKIENLVNLGIQLKDISKETKNLAFQKNNWFTQENIDFSINHWSNILNQKNIEKWISKYKFETKNKNLGIICAGNIPFVGLFDVICGYLSEYNLKIKLASSDNILMKIATDFLIEKKDKKIEIVDFFKNIDTVIATGSNNTFRYFDYYFRDIPNVLRKNRTSISVLNGEETKEDLMKLADDFFLYFGLGCRNISKIFLPKNYDLDKIFNAFYHYKNVEHHNKYKNNYDYNRAIYLLEQIPFLENGFFMLRESEDISSPLSVLYYQYYEDINNVEYFIEKNKDKIQCIVSNELQKENVKFGDSQKPNLDVYADNIDIMAFLK